MLLLVNSHRYFEGQKKFDDFFLIYNILQVAFNQV